MAYSKVEYNEDFVITCGEEGSPMIKCGEEGSPMIKVKKLLIFDSTKYGEIESEIERAPLLIGAEKTEENKRKYCCNVCIMCPNCEEFYSYFKNPLLIWSTGESACKACILKAVDEDEKENIPLIVNKDLNVNNHVILKAIQYSGDTTGFTNKLDEKIGDKNIFQTIEEEYDSCLNQFRLKMNEVDAIDDCRRNFNLIRSMLLGLHCVRSNLEISHPDHTLKDALKAIREPLSFIKETMKELDYSIWRILSCLIGYEQFHIVLSISNITFLDTLQFFTALLNFYTHDRKRSEYSELRCKGNTLLITKVLSPKFLKKRNIIIIDHETLDLKYQTRGVFFTSSVGDIIIHLNQKSLIAPEIISLCTSTKGNRFTLGMLSVDNNNIALKMRTTCEMKWKRNYEWVGIFKKPFRGMVSFTKPDDEYQLYLIIHSEWVDEEFSFLGYIEEEDYLLLSQGNYEIKTFGVFKLINS